MFVMGAESSVQRDGKSQEDAPASASASAGELSAEVLHEGDSVLDSKVQPRLCDPCHCVDHHAQWAWSQTPASHVMRLFFFPVSAVTLLLYIVHLRVCRHTCRHPSFSPLPSLPLHFQRHQRRAAAHWLHVRLTLWFFAE